MRYRLNHKELFADSFATFVYDPNFVKKNTPNFYRYVLNLDPRIKKIINKTRNKQVVRIVKGIKKDLLELHKFEENPPCPPLSKREY